MFELREYDPAYGQTVNRMIDEDEARRLLLLNTSASSVDWAIAQLKADASAQVTCHNGVIRHVPE